MIQLQNILIYFIRTAIFRNILYISTVTKVKSHIIESVIAISYSRFNQSKRNASFFEMLEKIMQRTLCSTRLIKTLKSIETIKFHDDKYEFLNVQR